jgi:hypothetical protein
MALRCKFFCHAKSNQSGSNADGDESQQSRIAQYVFLNQSDYCLGIFGRSVA